MDGLAGCWIIRWQLSELPYEQGGSSVAFKGLQGGTVLRERNAKMDGS